jgi:hypothetical protein
MAVSMGPPLQHLERDAPDVVQEDESPEPGSTVTEGPEV